MIYPHLLNGLVDNWQWTDRLPEVVSPFPATNFTIYIIELIQLHDTIDAIQIEWYYAWIYYNIAIRRHLMT